MNTSNTFLSTISYSLPAGVYFVSVDKHYCKPFEANHFVSTRINTNQSKYCKYKYGHSHTYS